MYDIIMYGTDNIAFDILKYRFPAAKKISNLDKLGKSSFTKFYWLLYENYQINENFDPSYQVVDGDENFVQVFGDGLFLIPKNRYISHNEIKHMFFVNKKDIKTDTATLLRSPLYDIVFISYNESNADKNYKNLLVIAPWAQRVHGVKGIHNAHVKAAEIARTDMFWIVDGDATIVNGFDFFHPLDEWELNTVHVWRSKNPINDLCYGYGGVKLFPKELTMKMDTNSTDMTTSISKDFKIHDDIANITSFNTDPYSTWKSAFRECSKLASKTIKGQQDQETDNRLQVWQTKGADRQFGTYCIDGARAGTEYGRKHSENPDALRMINDFDWLKKIFDERYK
jgi:hypothetical protein